MTRRDELIAIAVGLVVLVVGALIAGDGAVPGWEESVFHAVNGLPDWLYPMVWPGNLLGVLVIVPVVAVLALGVRLYWLAVAVVIAGVAKLVFERIVKAIVTRERPGTSIGSDIETRGDVSVSGESFVSGHAILAAAVATVVAPYVSPAPTNRPGAGCPVRDVRQGLRRRPQSARRDLRRRPRRCAGDGDQHPAPGSAPLSYGGVRSRRCATRRIRDARRARRGRSG